MVSGNRVTQVIASFHGSIPCLFVLVDEELEWSCKVV